jgi:glutamate-ammonia-ligase adenylyltransferase
MLRRAADAGFIERTDAERLRAARTLLSDVQALLRLTLNGDEAAFDEAAAPEGQRRLIAVTEDADDLAELGARIAAETTAARAIYRRIVEQPARDAGWQPRTDDRRSDG